MQNGGKSEAKSQPPTGKRAVACLKTALCRAQLRRLCDSAVLQIQRWPAPTRGGSRVYWRAWQGLVVRFKPSHAKGCPRHWQTYGTRVSALTGSQSPRKAVNPANAVLNYLYAILEAEARIAGLLIPGLLRVSLWSSAGAGAGPAAASGITTAGRTAYASPSRSVHCNSTEPSCHGRLSLPDLRFHMWVQPGLPSTQGALILVCDYQAPLQSTPDLPRISNYCVLRATDARSAEELCGRIPAIALLVLNTCGTEADVGELVGRVRLANPGLQILHIGGARSADVPDDVPTIPEAFTPEFLLSYVTALIERRPLPPLPGDGLPWAPAPTPEVDWGRRVPVTVPAGQSTEWA